MVSTQHRPSATSEERGRQRVSDSGRCSQRGGGAEGPSSAAPSALVTLCVQGAGDNTDVPKAHRTAFTTARWASDVCRKEGRQKKQRKKTGKERREREGESEREGSKDRSKKIKGQKKEDKNKDSRQKRKWTKDKVENNPSS